MLYTTKNYSEADLTINVVMDLYLEAAKTKDRKFEALDRALPGATKHPKPSADQPSQPKAPAGNGDKQLSRNQIRNQQRKERKAAEAAAVANKGQPAAPKPDAGAEFARSTRVPR